MSSNFSYFLQKTFKYLCLSACFSFSLHTTHAQTQTQTISAGHYQAILGDCVACHTGAHRQPYSGGLAFTLPIGTIYSTNITPDPLHGIGTYTEKEFARAVREGIRKDGKPLYPAMPFPSYARLSNADIHQLYLYFHTQLQPIASDPPPNTISWPLSMRWPLHIWQWLFAPNVKNAQEKTAHEYSDPVLARGAYLVEGAGHCGACHTPRSITMNEKALTASDGALYLSGGSVVDGWLAPSLRQENQTGLGRWSEQDIVDFLKNGYNRYNMAFGGMSDVITHSSYGFTDPDLHAIARYLLTLKPTHQEHSWQENTQTRTSLIQGDSSARGAQIYLDRCAACHRIDGHGYQNVFPALAGNPVVLTDDPTSLVHIIQSGVHTPTTPNIPSSFSMPGFAHQLSDDEITDVVNFIRNSWGNHAEPVIRNNVTKLRQSMPPLTPDQEQPKN